MAILKVVGASWMQTKISSYILGILGVLAILALFIGQIERIQDDGIYAATVFYSNKTGYRIEYWGQNNKLSEIERGAARAYFTMDLDTTGWALLEIETNGAYRDDVQAYAAGVVEGALTWYLIHNHLQNTINAKCQNKLVEKQCDRLRDALDRSVDTWKKRASDNEDEDPFWHHVSLHYAQIRGIFTGWKRGVERSQNSFETDISDLYWLNSVSEVMEIQHKLNITLENSTLDFLPHLSSAFLKIGEDIENEVPVKKLFLAQNAAGSYSSMTRILKRYKLNYHLTSKSTETPSGVAIEFSGYPGSITSQNEFYLVKGENHRMAISGTPLRNYNSKLWKETNFTEQIPVGPRITAANHLATNVSSWGHMLARSNSGTACKQWLLVDFNRFDRVSDVIVDKQQKIDANVSTESIVVNDVKHTVVHRSSSSRAKGLVWLIEQVPGRTHSADISDAFLEQGYWATYGLPFFNDIAEVTQTTKMEEQYGNIFSTTNSPRAMIFRQGYINATSVGNVFKFMRQNNISLVNQATNETGTCLDNDISCIVKEDGYWAVLGVRGDLIENYKQPYGVIDTKILTATVNHSKIEFDAYSGPPFTSILQDNVTDIFLNKGNLAPIYTNQFDDEPFGKIEELIAKEKEKALEELEILNKDLVKPFSWSSSGFGHVKRVELPDDWAFKSFRVAWAW